MAGRVSPADMVKAVVLEPQSPVVKVTTRRKKCLGSLWTAITAATLCIGMNRRPIHLRRDGHWPVRPSKGMSGAPTSASDV
jgi:hypothetical protein